uniref:DNA polymerase kappa n=1 Tax=Chromera velia CCMP2878 TaxID=1169474 RepID=A0A0G4HYG8_9ALVE|eukprot:Cvel_9488.t1-p1 / transcript=Cvel_9488.t1 / gene=Cvel_9488 / organism=Chromera_velia_CCMP2878 / gene_product=DNA polymerase kappa, putative / transcript_product=DNA polymerase kappa, putative / location=Cvel_scaffold548:21246-29642(+) / protein_length=1237 / sequence_SO=supercontig / SO=protein_coding / is_pseudo=false
MDENREGCGEEGVHSSKAGEIQDNDVKETTKQEETAEVQSADGSLVCQSTSAPTASLFFQTSAASSAPFSSSAAPSASSSTHALPAVYANNLKAGMTKVDRAHVDRVIFESSKNSSYYVNEIRKTKQLEVQIEKLKKKAQSHCETKALFGSRGENAFVEKVRKECTDAERKFFMHIDMDMFYCAVEIRDNPSIAEKPVAVGGLSMICTANYIARHYGVRSAMPGFIAKRLCPSLVFVPTNFEKYTREAEKVREVLAKYDPHFVSASLDEAYLDITACLEDRLRSKSMSQHTLADTQREMGGEGEMEFGEDEMFMEAQRVASELREGVRKATNGLTASAGVGPSRMLAKVCSDLCKPNGQKVLTLEETPAFVDSLSVRKIPGVGRCKEKELEALGIDTCGEMLRRASLVCHCFSQVTAHFLVRSALGLDVRERGGDRKSCSCERTFAATGDGAFLLRMIGRMARRLSRQLNEERVLCRHVALKVKTAGFVIRNISEPLSRLSDDATEIANAGARTLIRFLQEDHRNLKGEEKERMTMRPRKASRTEEEVRREEAARERARGEGPGASFRILRGPAAPAAASEGAPLRPRAEQQAESRSPGDGRARDARTSRGGAGVKKEEGWSAKKERKRLSLAEDGGKEKERERAGQKRQVEGEEDEEEEEEEDDDEEEEETETLLEHLHAQFGSSLPASTVKVRLLGLRCSQLTSVPSGGTGGRDKNKFFFGNLQRGGGGGEGGSAQFGSSAFSSSAHTAAAAAAGEVSRHASLSHRHTTHHHQQADLRVLLASAGSGSNCKGGEEVPGEGIDQGGGVGQERPRQRFRLEPPPPPQTLVGQKQKNKKKRLAAQAQQQTEAKGAVSNFLSRYLKRPRREEGGGQRQGNGGGEGEDSKNPVLVYVESDSSSHPSDTPESDCDNDMVREEEDIAKEEEERGMDEKEGREKDDAQVKERETESVLPPAQCGEEQKERSILSRHAEAGREAVFLDGSSLCEHAKPSFDPLHDHDVGHVPPVTAFEERKPEDCHADVKVQPERQGREEHNQRAPLQSSGNHPASSSSSSALICAHPSAFAASVARPLFGLSASAGERDKEKPARIILPPPQPPRGAAATEGVRQRDRHRAPSQSQTSSKPSVGLHGKAPPTAPRGPLERWISSFAKCPQKNQGCAEEGTVLQDGVSREGRPPASANQGMGDRGRIEAKRGDHQFGPHEGGGQRTPEEQQQQPAVVALLPQKGNDISDLESIF